MVTYDATVIQIFHLVVWAQVGRLCIRGLIKACNAREATLAVRMHTAFICTASLMFTCGGAVALKQLISSLLEPPTTNLPSLGKSPDRDLVPGDQLRSVECFSCFSLTGVTLCCSNGQAEDPAEDMPRARCITPPDTHGQLINCW